MAGEKIKTLGQFTDRVGKLRKSWKIESHKELWFRGEGEMHGSSLLRPELYRSVKQGRPARKIFKLLEIEYDLYEAFMHGAVQLSSEKTEDDNWDWDSYFLMQHHQAPTRLLDWSDGALIALHFAVRNEKNDAKDAFVYVLEPDHLKEKLLSLQETKSVKKRWKAYVKKHPSYDLSDDEWEYSYLPDDKDGMKEVPLPKIPLLLDFPHITRRVAAQRSRFMVFGTDSNWLAEEFRKPKSLITAITIDANSKAAIRVELRDGGITESVIFPDLDGLGREIRRLWKERTSLNDKN